MNLCGSLFLGGRRQAIAVYILCIGLESRPGGRRNAEYRIPDSMSPLDEADTRAKRAQEYVWNDRFDQRSKSRKRISGRVEDIIIPV